MAKTINITLGESSYAVPHLNMGQIEELSEIYEEPDYASSARKFKTTKRIATLLLRRAEPKIEDFSTIECTTEELAVAIRSILAASGLQTGATPGEAPAKD